jgi:DNA-binding NarL/FixJ family response regulator
MIVNDDLVLVGEASDGAEAVRLCEKYQPDVVLMDLMMPVMDGVTATRIIRERFPAINVIVLTSFKEKELVEGALQAGAVGYLLKTVSADELASAIRAASAGQSRLSPEASQMLEHDENDQGHAVQPDGSAGYLLGFARLWWRSVGHGRDRARRHGQIRLRGQVALPRIRRKTHINGFYVLRALMRPATSR